MLDQRQSTVQAPDPVADAAGSPKEAQDADGRPRSRFKDLPGPWVKYVRESGGERLIDWEDPHPRVLW